MSLRQYLREVSIPVYVIVSLFAISSWIDINGLFVESPLLVSALPERWRIFSYLAVLIQVANVGPIAYVTARKLAPERIKEWPAVYVIIGIGAAACFLLAFFWRETTTIGGELHSTALFVLVGFLALVDCTSSVVYLPYMGQYKPQYLTAYYIGEGLSGMIPGFVGLIQGVQSEPECVNKTVLTTNETTGETTTTHVIVANYPPPLFSVEVFFFFLFAMMLLSGVAFTLLNFLPYCKKERVLSQYSYDVSKQSEAGVLGQETDRNKPPSPSVNADPPPSQTKAAEYALTLREATPRKPSVDDEAAAAAKSRLSKAQCAYVLLLTALLNALLNGVMPSTRVYTCLPYGSLAFTVAVRLAAVTNPLVCFLALFTGTKSLITVSVLAAGAVGLSGWHLFLAVMSPFPPLKGTVAGTALIIVTQVVNIGCIAYVNVANSSILNAYGGSWWLMWNGAATQVGSVVGAVVTFVFVNVLMVFKSEPACPGMTY